MYREHHLVCKGMAYSSRVMRFLYAIGVAEVMLLGGEVKRFCGKVVK